ncbi:PH and SEC7 domain-containing protein 4-like [Pseudophryne corroboree]|uniref:PH and SEC7 domain-containing protein 4-like n=1 Tax=Pseudophryne corroboree TaxID=495146 RepID=UPI003081BD2B
MEKQQLSVDDDLLPIYYVSPDRGPGTFSRVWQEHEVSSSASNLNLLASLDHGGLAAARPNTERSRFYTHGHKDQEGTRAVCLISGTNGEASCADKAYSSLQKEVFPDLQQLLPKATDTRTQVNPMAKSSSAQDVILASLLQVQLCVLDLQDQIDISETCRLRAREPQSEAGPPYVEFNDALRENPHQDREEDQESDDTFYSEVEDERLFCDNPLFNNSKPLYPVGHSMQQPVPAVASENGHSTGQRIETQGNELLLAQNVWDRNGTGTRNVVWHQMTREESLEELQIYEDEWEEKQALSARTRKWHLTDSLQYTQEAFACAEDAPRNVTACILAPEAPEVSPCQEAAVEEDEGLLFSEPGLWALLLADEESEHKLPTSLTSVDHSSTSQMQEQPGEEGLFISCHNQDVPLEEKHEESIHLFCQGCQGKEHVGRGLPLEGRTEELAIQQSTQEIVPDQSEGRTGELQMKSQQSTQDIVTDQSEGRTEELQMKSQQDTPEIVIDQCDDVSTDFETSGSEEVTYVDAVAITQDAEAARCLAVKLFHLDGFKRSQVAAYLQKNNDFSAMVAEEYLSLFDFTGKSLDVALRSLLQELVLTGETQERERVLFHFSTRFHSCNPKDFRSADAVHTLTCALMLLNSDLHGQNIGKSMTAQEFINNLDGMNDDGNFPRELLKGLYQAIRVEKLEWAVSEEKLANVNEKLLSRPENLLSVRKKSSPFLDIPAPDPQAPIYKQGTLCRKVHAYIDGKKTPWGKRGWKAFHTVLKGMLLFFLKDEYRSDFQFPEEVISVHHALAEKAREYTKRPHVFRLQTADWRVFLFQAQTSDEMNSWISRINLVAAMFSSPPFPAAVGSQKRFYRPILPTAQCKLDLEEQLQSHEGLMDSFTDDLTEHQRNLPDSKSKTRDWEDYHLREEYLRYEKLRYETYVKILALRMESSCEDLHTFEPRIMESDGGQEEGSGLKRSYSSPSLNPEIYPVAVKVKRNISERRTYRRIIPKRNKNLV